MECPIPNSNDCSGMSKYLFAYGTLQVGHAPPAMAPTVAKLRPVGEGSVPGLLYDFGDYPGVVLNAPKERKIFGTVFEVPSGQDAWRVLDDYEGFNPLRPEASLFIRVLQSVQFKAGGTLECWVYVYNQSVDGARLVESGVYGKRR
jgi:gamma-glutamylcyclotransferase (GGCT)/AIG2-like uncharacterized protein YtfP